MKSASIFLNNTRKELLEKEKELKEDLSHEGEQMEESLKTGIKSGAVIGGALLLSYSAFKLLTSDSLKHSTKKNKKKLHAGLSSSIISFATRSMISYMTNRMTDDQEESI